MTKRKSDFTLPTNSLDELFSSQEERDDAKLERVKDIPLTELHPFKDHPFKIKNDDEMKRMVESIQKFGTLTPALARPLPMKQSLQWWTPTCNENIFCPAKKHLPTR